MNSVVSIRVKYVAEDTDRHGNVRLYYRRPGYPKIRLPGPSGSPEFWAAYQAASTGPRPEKIRKPGEALGGSLRWLCQEYFKTPEFAKLEPKTRGVRRKMLERCCDHVWPGADVPDGDRAFAEMRAKHVRQHRDRLAATPGMAGELVKALRILFTYAIRYDLTNVNPAAGIERLAPVKAGGYHSWTVAEVEQYEARHPIGTTARLALALALYTGQRRHDLATLGRQHERGGRLCFTQHKGRNKSPVHLEIPIIPELRRIIDASPTGDLTYIVGTGGLPLKANSLGNKARDWCNEAGLPHCSLHGLRKAAATRLADQGCSAHEIAAVTGHQTLKEVERYTKAANQKRLADRAMSELTENGDCPTSEGGAESGTISPVKELKSIRKK